MWTGSRSFARLQGEPPRQANHRGFEECHAHQKLFPRQLQVSRFVGRRGAQVSWPDSAATARSATEEHADLFAILPSASPPTGLSFAPCTSSTSRSKLPARSRRNLNSRFSYAALLKDTSSTILRLDMRWIKLIHWPEIAAKGLLSGVEAVAPQLRSLKIRAFESALSPASNEAFWPILSKLRTSKRSSYVSSASTSPNSFITSNRCIVSLRRGSRGGLARDHVRGSLRAMSLI